MKIAIMGSGGIGGYYGAELARAGHDVTFIARGAHLKAMRETGLKIKSVHGSFSIEPVKATDAPAEGGPVDLVLFCVKTPDTEAAAQSINPIVGSGTAVLSLQNGIDAVERIGGVVGIEHVLAGATWISSAVEAPGLIRQVSRFRRIVLGEPSGSVTSRTLAVAEALRDTGAMVGVAEDIHKVLWTKFVFIAAISAVGALTRLPIGDYRVVPETRALLESLMRDVEAVARASDVALDAEVIAGAMNVVDHAEPGIRASMQRDVETGRRSELESMVGVIGRKGRRLGVATPAADMVYAALLPVEIKARQRHFET